MSATRSVRSAPAKLNLSLAVTGKRPDGFHALHSVMVPLELADTVSIALAGPDATCDVMAVSGADLDCSPDNLVLRAVAAAREAVRGSWPGAPGSPPFVDARLTKRIPIAAGLAGGSSDAAAALAASLEVWGAQLAPERRSAVAAAIGSDVPFFLAGCPALVTGRGEQVEPLPAFAGQVPFILLVTPRLALSTAAVYAAYDAGARPEKGALAVSEKLVAAIRDGDPYVLQHEAELAAANDLIPAAQAVAPALAGLRRSLAELLARPVGQSGSGPTLWAFCGDEDEARRDASLVRRALKAGTLDCPGDGPPFVAVSAITGPRAGEAPGPATRQN